MRKTWGKVKALTTIWDTNWYYMREMQGTVNYKSQMKQTPTHIQHKTNICRIWGIDYSNHNNLLSNIYDKVIIIYW